MKKQNLYNVTVVGSFTKDILVWAEDEDAALDFAQSICDNTDLIRFEGDELLEITAEDVEEIDPFDGFEANDGGTDNAADDRSEGSCSVKIVGSANNMSVTDGESVASERKETEGSKYSSDACANCASTESPSLPTPLPFRLAKKPKLCGGSPSFWAAPSWASLSTDYAGGYYAASVSASNESVRTDSAC